MASGGDTSLIEQMKRTSPNAQNEWQSHFISHMDAAGITPKDLGIEDKELGKNYLASRGFSNNVMQQQIIEPNDFNFDNCGTCDQYLGELKNHVRKYAKGAKKSISSLPESQREMGKISVENLLKKVWDSWENKSRATGVKDEAIDVGNKIIDNWNQHSVDSHGVSLHPDPLVHTPVVEGKIDKLKNFYRKIRNLPPGWEAVNNDEDTVVTKDFDKIEDMFPKNDRDAPILLKQKPKMKDGREMTPEDALTLYRMINPGGQTMVKGPGGTDRIEYEGPKFIGHENGKYYRKTTPANQEYRPADDPRVELFTDPVHTGDRPEIHKVYENHTGTQCFNRDCNDPKHCNGDHTFEVVAHVISIPTVYRDGKPVSFRSESIKEMQTVNYKREGCTKCYKPNCDGWHVKDQPDLRMIPRQHAFLFQKAGIDPDLAAHKEYQDKLHAYETLRQPAPTEEDRAKAKADYQASFDNALEKAYPGMGKEEALGKLADEHRERVLKLEVIHNQSMQSVHRRINANKEKEQRPVFNAGILKRK